MQPSENSWQKICLKSQQKGAVFGPAKVLLKVT
jgi:hypothetical protein